jgi:hypothetical protein|tara:strand:- start:124 stop:282 length:159 start_codon:yes stop_codon:yes gene_type:complete
MLVRERIKRWYRWSQWNGVKLERILIHPDDADQVPPKYKGLPVQVFGAKIAR